VRRAIYPGSFDPVTNGHLDVIARASQLFDQVVVGVVNHPVRKGKTLFETQERLSFIHEATAPLGNVRAEAFDVLVVEFARRVGDLEGSARDAEVRHALLAGNLPEHLRHLTAVTLEGRGRDGAPLTVTFCVMPDYLAVGSDSDSLIVPMGLLAAMSGVWLTKGDNNVFTQIGLIVLVGLSAKNAILIVEFARELEFAGRTPVRAAIEASRLRLRPILMTSLAFIMGVVPLVISTGAGSEMRHAMGVAVFSGMIGVTAFGIFFTPMFYVLLRALAGNRPLTQHGQATVENIVHSRAD
jgi:cytidyltransferase-like protein